MQWMSANTKNQYKMTPGEKQLNIDNLIAYKTKDPKLYSAIPGWGSYVDPTDGRLFQKVGRKVSENIKVTEENNVFYNKKFKNNSSHQMANCLTSQEKNIISQHQENLKNSHCRNWMSYLSQKIDKPKDEAYNKNNSHSNDLINHKRIRVGGIIQEN